MNETPHPSFIRTYLRGELILQSGNIIGRGLGLANSFIILASLSVYQFGLYQLVLAAIAIADSVSAGMFDDVIMNDISRELAEGERRKAKRLFLEFATLKVGIGILVAALVFVGANIVSSFYSADIADFVRIASFLLFFQALRTVFDSFFVVAVSFSGTAILGAQEVVRFIMFGAFRAGGMLGIREILLTGLLSTAIALVIATVAFLRRYRESFGGVKAHPASVLRMVIVQHGAWVYLRYAFSKLSKSMHPWLVKLFLNTEAVGLYSFALNLAVLIQSVFPIEAAGRLLPWQVADRNRFGYIFSRAVKYALWSGVFLALISAAAMPALTYVVLPKYVPAMSVFFIMLFSLPLYGIYKLHKILLTVFREQQALAQRVVAESFIVAALQVVLLPLLKKPGAALEMVLSYIWRVWVLAASVRRLHPDLVVPLGSLFHFDHEDRIFFQTAWREARSMMLSRFRSHRERP